MTTAKTKTTQHLSFALGGQSRGVYFLTMGDLIFKLFVIIMLILINNRQTK